MGDRITTIKDCPKCGAKGTFECYEALSSNLKLDECLKCGYTVQYYFVEKKDGIHIVRTTPELPKEPSIDPKWNNHNPQNIGTSEVRPGKVVDVPVETIVAKANDIDLIKNLEQAAKQTIDYLYPIKGEVSPETYQAIARLRQLINEEFKPEKLVSSQFIYDILKGVLK